MLPSIFSPLNITPMNPEQAHAILSRAASRALLDEADRFAAIQARDVLGAFVKEHTEKDAAARLTREIKIPDQDTRIENLARANGKAKR